MTEQEARALTMKLLGAWPSSAVGETTVVVYIEAFMRLRYYAAGVDAVDALILTERWLPPVALVVDEYRRHREKHLPPALPEAEITEDQRELNLSYTKAMVAHLTARGHDGHSGDFADCGHAGCTAARELVTAL